MPASKLPKELKSDPADQEPLVEQNPQLAWNQTKYRAEYCEIAYKLLAESDDCKNRAHVCAALRCSKPTLLAWEKKYPAFGLAVKNGLEIGKAKWYQKLADYAYQPSKQVNNGLIKLLSANVYGIKEEPSTVIFNQNSMEFDPEEYLKKKGIPVPEIEIPDVDE